MSSSRPNPIPADDDDPLHELLREACQAPAVPKSLIRRMDRHVAQVWGESPRLHRSGVDPWIRLAQRTLEGARTWSMVAMAATVCFVVFLISGGDEYSWAEMIKRLQQESLIRITESAGTAPLGTESSATTVRWFSPRNDLVAEQTAQQILIADFHRSITLDYQVGDTMVVRNQLNPAVAGSDVSSRLVSFLLAGNGEWQTAAPEVTVESESWKHVVRNGRTFVELVSQVSLVDGSPTLRVAALLEPRSGFPATIRVSAPGAEMRTLSLRRLSAGHATVAIPGFPSQLPIVEGLPSGDRIATRMQSGGIQAAPASKAPASTEVVGTEGDSVTTITSGAADAPRLTAANTQVVRGSTNLGWQPVAPISAPREEVVQQVNQLLADVWRAEDLKPAEAASDSQFMRRLYLDLTGRIPTVGEVRDFQRRLAAGEDRNDLIDDLLASADHASHVATVWRNFLLPDGVDFTELGGTFQFDRWLADQVQDGVPYDETVRRLLLAEGRLARSGPLLFYSAAKLNPEQLAGRTARVFLGMRLECAQCHDDPFEPWTQNDFWSFAAYFAQISRPRGELEAASPVLRVRDVAQGEVMLPDQQVVVAPRLLDGTTPTEGGVERHRRVQLAEWLTAKENPFFARATANRVWAILMGRGIVDPVDGFGATNQPANPELLDLLSGYLIATGFDLRSLFDVIARTDAYQLSSGSDDAGVARRQWFAQMHVKALSASQLYDCISVATLLESGGGSTSAPFNLDRIGNTVRQQFVNQFGASNSRTTEYPGGIPQALTMMNGSLISSATGLQRSGLLDSLQAPFFSDDQRIQVIFRACVSREPTPEERALCHEVLAQSESDEAGRQEVFADILWALLNGAEFTLNH